MAMYLVKCKNYTNTTARTGVVKNITIDIPL